MKIAMHTRRLRERRSLWLETEEKKAYTPVNGGTALRISTETEGGALSAIHQTLADCEIDKLALGTYINTVRTVQATEA